MVDDPYLWLEDVTGETAMEWVRQHNEPSLTALCGDRFDQMVSEALEVLETDTRIPYVHRRGEYLYNFWRDAEHPRGIWRRTTLEQYRTDAPEWDVLIDADALAAADNERWVWAGATMIRPECTLALVSLSRGGSDATIVREFDMRTREFVDDGFTLPEAKSAISWEDENAVLVGTDFGDGSLTDSGYPRFVRRWRRGEPLCDAETLFTAAQADVVVQATVDRTPGFERTLVRRYHLLLAGASWMAEYGNPDDPADWEFMRKYSPYHNISADRRYPPVLFITSTRDDRVHPAHARKMTAALEAAGHRVHYYENIEGGHAGAADRAQAAFRDALTFEFLLRTLSPASADAG